MSATAAAAFAASGLLGTDVGRRAAARLRTRDGRDLPLVPHRWHGEADDLEAAVLGGVRGPVLDLACGPGRLVRHLQDRGVEALGVDSSPDAVEAARLRGAPAVLGDLWGPLPAEGSWATALLFDGNIGIGARPAALLRRCAELLAPGGTVVAEVGPPGTTTGASDVRLECGSWRSGWFPWATVGPERLPALAGAAGLRVARVRAGAGRCFAWLERGGAPAPPAGPGGCPPPPPA